VSNAAGTIESVAIELSKLLRPLATELATPAKARAFFAQLGFLLSNAQVAGIGPPLSTAASGTGDLIAIVKELIEAIEAENFGTIVSKGMAAIQKIVAIIQALSSLGSQLSGLVGVPADKVAKRLFDYLLFKYLNGAREVNDALELLGLLDREDHNEDSEDPNNPPFTVVTYHFDQLGGWFSDPAGQVHTLYDWGNNFDGSKLFSRIEGMLARNGLPVIYEPAPIPRLDIVFLEAVPKTDVNPHGLTVRLKNKIAPSTQTIELGSDAKIDLKVDFQLPLNMELSILPNGNVKFVPPAPGGALNGDVSLKLTAERTQPPEPFILFGQAGGSRLELAKFTLTAGTHVTWDGSKANGDFLLEGNLEHLKVIIDTTHADGFLGKILPETKVDADFSLVMGISTAHGFYFGGSGALVVQLPLHLSLGPVELEAMTIAAKLQGGEIPVSIGVDIRAALGPLLAVVENIGVVTKFSFPPGNSGNLGPLQFDLGFKPPNGVGLSLDVGVVKGGGYLYFDFDKEEYAGALELDVMDIVTVKAIGLVTTRMPDGSKGFSLLIIISAEFTGIQLGFGFTLNGLGGLLGLNRTMQLEVIATGVRTGGINSIMFPKDIIANAQRIISDLRSYFPPQEGHFLIGLMAKIGWGTPTLASLSLGVIVEIPPGKVAILGILKVALPTEDAALIVIQVNFIGAIEPDKDRLWFFAELFESRVLFIPIEGGMGLLVAWGDNANFVLSVGGFHPRFNPPPLPFPVPKRVAFDIYNTPVSRIRVEGYFAVTSNTVQFGAHVEMRLGLDEIGIFGHVAFDALFQFSPFYFIIEISGSVELKVFGIGLFSIRLDFSLEGPTPWRAKGSGTLSLLFFDVSADFDITWGDKEDTSLPPIEVLPMLVAEFNKTENWRAQLPKSNKLLVSLRPLEDTAGLVLHPVGTLLVSQRGVPLDLDIAKVGSQKISDAKRFTVKSNTVGLDKKGDRQEPFALGQFLDLNNDEKLSRKAYETKNSGLELSVAGRQAVASRAVKRIVRYEMIVLDSRYKKQLFQFFSYSATLFRHFLRGNAAARSPLSAATQKMFVPFEDKVTVRQEGYAVATSFNNKAINGGQAFFDSQSAAFDFMNAQTAANPNLGEVLHVIPAHEVVTQ